MSASANSPSNSHVGFDVKITPSAPSTTNDFHSTTIDDVITSQETPAKSMKFSNKSLHPKVGVTSAPHTESISAAAEVIIDDQPHLDSDIYVCECYEGTQTPNQGSKPVADHAVSWICLEKPLLSKGL